MAYWHVNVALRVPLVHARLTGVFALYSLLLRFDETWLARDISVHFCIGVYLDSCLWKLAVDRVEEQWSTSFSLRP